MDLGGSQQRVTAFSDDLTRAIGKRAGFSVLLLQTTLESIPSNFRIGRIDAALTAIYPTPEARSLYDFSDPYLFIGPVLVVPGASPVDSLEGMRGKIVGAAAGTVAMVLIAKAEGIVIRDYINIAKGLEDLATGAIDGVVMPALLAYAYIRDFYSGRLKVATPPLTDEGLRLIVKKGENRQLIDSFNSELKSFVDEGGYDALQSKWGLDLNEGPYPF